MEREQDRWKRLYAHVLKICPVDHNLRHRHPDSLIVGVLLWAALHERPIDWARRREHWPAAIRPPVLPSQSCMSRRLRACAVAQLLERLHASLREQLPCGVLKYIDAKPLPVGGCTKDHDATYGRAAGGKAKGYKLFAVVDAISGAVETWLLDAMSYAEQNAAMRLIPRCASGTLLVGDKIYDAMRLYDLAAAGDKGFLARLPKDVHGYSRGPQSQPRLHAIHTAHSAVGVALLDGRNGIERAFAHLTSCSGGLLSLPAWVRTPHRVVSWVAAKLLINLDRQCQIHRRYGNDA